MDWMRRGGGAALAAAFLCTPLWVSGARPASAQAARPNVLIILTDDQRARGTMSVMPETRRIFGDNGTRYSNAVATTPLCCPSRSSIFSGRYAHNHGVLTNEDAQNFDHTKTLQHELGESGYTTAIVGKFLNLWRLNDPPSFDRWATQSPGSYYNNTFNIDGHEVSVPGYSTTFIGQQASAFLDDFETEDSTPWFMEVAPFGPHFPGPQETVASMAEARYADAVVPPWNKTPAMSEEDLSDKPSYVQQSPALESDAAALREGQLRALMSVDDMVERLFAKLSSLGEARNTLAFFLSDNGWTWFEHHLAGKKAPYSASVRIPFFARWPGRIAAGAVDDRIVANIDIAPTVYEATGVEPGYPVDGKRLTSSARPYIFLEHLTYADLPVPKWRSIWTPARHYVRYSYTDGRRSREFYGADDPWELENVYRDGVAGNEPTDEARLDELIRAGAACVGAFCT
jgi:arylsulfatase A-like enzyme